MASRAASTASAVPRRSRCTKAVASGRSRFASSATASWSGPITTASASPAPFGAAPSTCASSDRPATGCSTLGSADRIRVPSPAASTIVRLVLPVIPHPCLTAMVCAAVLEALSRSGNPIRHRANGRIPAAGAFPVNVRGVIWRALGGRRISMARDPIHRAGSFEAENSGGAPAGLFADEDDFDRRSLFRLASWGAVAVSAVAVALYTNQSSIGWSARAGRGSRSGAAGAADPGRLPKRARTRRGGSPRRSIRSTATATGCIRASPCSNRGSTPSPARSRGRRQPWPLHRRLPRRPPRASRRRWRQARRPRHQIRRSPGRTCGHREGDGGKTCGKAGCGCQSAARRSPPRRCRPNRKSPSKPALRGSAGNAVDGLEIDPGSAGCRGRKPATPRSGAMAAATRDARAGRWLPRFRPPKARHGEGGSRAVDAAQSRGAENRICGRRGRRKLARRLARAVARPAQIAIQRAVGGVASDHHDQGKQHGPWDAVEARRRPAQRCRRGRQDLRGHGREPAALRDRRCMTASASRCTAEDASAATLPPSPVQPDRRRTGEAMPSGRRSRSPLQHRHRAEPTTPFDDFRPTVVRSKSAVDCNALRPDS